MFKKLALGLTICLLAVGAACAPETEPSNTPSKKLTVGLTYQPDIQFSMFYAAQELGYFDELGLDVTIRHHGSSESLFGALESGAEDIVFAAGDEMLQARSEGTDVVNFATIYQSHPVVLIVPDASEIAEPADLAGHSVGIPGPFGENYFGLLALLQRAELAESDVEVVHIGYTLQAALQSERVDAVMGFINNDAVRFEAAGFPVRTISITADGLTPLVAAGLGASSELIENNSAELALLLTAVKRGIQFCIDNPEQAVEISQTYVPGLNDDEQQEKSLKTLLATIPLYGTGEQITSQNPARWEEMADFMAAAELLSGPVTVSDAYTANIQPKEIS